MSNEPIDNTETNSSDLIAADISLFYSLLSTCNAEHLSYCNCQEDLVKEQEQKIKEVERKKLEQKGLIGNPEIVSEVMDYIKQTALNVVGRQCSENKIVCPVERKMIEQNLKYFSSKYDLKDPRVYVIVDSLLHQMLSAHRMQMHSNSKGILSTWYDKEGNKRYSLNPVEELKLKYSEARIQAIVELDKIMEGNKINISGNIIVRDIDEIFKETVDLKEGDYRCIK